MSYCAVSDIQQDFKSIAFSSTSLVTDAAVSQFIIEAGALIDAYVGTKYVVPITADSSSLALMSLFCRVLVSDRVRGILENKQTTNTAANQNISSPGLTTKDVMSSLTSIKQGEMALSGASYLVPSAGFYSNNNANSIQPVFHKDRREW